MEPLVKICLCHNYSEGDDGLISCEFLIHEAILSNNCAYFQNVLKSSYREARTREFRFDTEVDRLDAWELLIHFFYTGKYQYGKAKNDYWILLDARVYVLADKLQANKLKDFALNKSKEKILATSRKFLGVEGGHRHFPVDVIPELIRTVYTNTYDNTLDVLEAQISQKECEVLGPSGSEATRAFAIPGSRKDKFRVLISRFCAETLPLLYKNASFLKVHLVTPEFALDLLTFIPSVGGRPLRHQ